MRAVRVQCRATVLQKHAQAKPMQSGVFNEYFAASRWLLDWVVSWWSVAPPRFYCEPGSKNDLVNGLGGVSGWLNWLCSTSSWMAKYTSCFLGKNVDIQELPYKIWLQSNQLFNMSKTLSPICWPCACANCACAGMCLFGSGLVKMGIAQYAKYVPHASFSPSLWIGQTISNR